MPMTALNLAKIYVKTPGRLPKNDAARQIQMAETVEFCEGRSLGIGTWFGDLKDSRDRFRQMMAEASGGEPKFDRIVVWRIVYFALTLEESVLEQKKLKARGIRLLSVKESKTDD